MTPRRANPLLTSALGMALAACAGVAAESEDGGSVPVKRSGDELLAAGDFDGAVRAYESAGAEHGSDAAREKLLRAKTRAAVAHAVAAQNAAEAGDLARAHDELVRAEMFGPDLPAVRSARETIGGRVAASDKAAQLREQAAAALVRDPEEAERLLAEARAIDPATGDDDAAAAKLQREATLRAEADRSAERAAAAWAEHDRARTARELAAARFGGRPVPASDALRLKIETEILAGVPRSDEAALRTDLRFAEEAELHASVEQAIRDRLVDRLLASAADLRDTRRPATAALLELEAVRLRPGVKTPSLDQIRGPATTTVLVAPFEDATGGRVDGAQLARALRERLALDALGGGLPLRALDETDAARAAQPDALRLTGRVLTARASEGRIGREDTRVRYQTGTTRRPNREFDAAVVKVTAAVSAVRAAEEDQKSATLALGSIREPGVVHGSAATHGADPAYQSRMSTAQTRADKADAALRSAKDAEAAARQQAAKLPREIEEPVWAEHVVTVTTSAKTLQITAHVDLSSGDATLLSQDVTAAAQHRETVSDGYPEGGIPPDPDDTPDDASMAAQAADRFAAMAAGRVRAAAEGGARKYLVAARGARAAGRRDEAAEAFAMYLLATPDAASEGRAEAARALDELLGVHVALATTPRKEEP